MDSRTETSEQIVVIEWCDLMSIPAVHIPNEGKRSVVYGAQLKRMGMRKGFPDIFIPVARAGYHGLFVEMKWGKNKTTTDQEEWLRTLSDQGYACTVVYSADDAIRQIKRYLKSTKTGG